MPKAQLALGPDPARCGIIPTNLSRVPPTESLRYSMFFTMTDTDNVWTAGDKYSWTSKSQQSLSYFLSKYKPSMVQDDGTKPWIWVRGSELSKRQETNENEARGEAEVLLEELTARVKAIQDDPLIPTRSNKKTGTRSKRELREEAQAEATDKLKQIAIKHNYVVGKWLILHPMIKSISFGLVSPVRQRSLVSGPLSTTAAFLAKVATSPVFETSNYRHVICIYVPNVYDRNAIVEVMKILLRNHGVSLAGVKADLYTIIGIDSNHPSGISSTIWKNTALLEGTEIKALKDQFYTDLNQEETNTGAPARDKDEGTTAKQGGVVPPTVMRDHKFKLRKKAKDDFFASDDEDLEKKRKVKYESENAATNAKRAKPK